MVVGRFNFSVLKECVLHFLCFAKSRTVAGLSSLHDSVPGAAHLGTVLLNLRSSETENWFPSDFFFSFFLPI